MKPKLLYALHSGNLYGTERMALVTMQGLQDVADPVLLVPPGPAIAEAVRLGIESIPFSSLGQFVGGLANQLRSAGPVAFFATGVSHSLVFIALNGLFRRRCVHAHLVHGGTDEKLSYGRKKALNGRAVVLIAVSDFVKKRLLAHGVRETQIKVIENFLPDEQIASTAPRRPFTNQGISRVIVVSRIDPIKRVDLLLDLLDRHPSLRQLEYDVYGTGWDLESLRARAAAQHPMVHFHGYSDRIPEAIAQSDLLLHLCPEEPFGLAILEAMAARVPVLVPDQGGAATLIEPEVSGVQFTANETTDLAARLEALREMPAGGLNCLAEAGYERIRSRYSSSVRLNEYRQLIAELLP